MSQSDRVPALSGGDRLLYNPYEYGAIGLWWGLAIGLASAAIILTWRFSTRKIC
ncbi:hypothetical protein [Nostoc sp.]|uniref:hypothetical protein n=1 Tax=Nostoc sp. TaxID=1180 RepID=UPI002FF82831